MQRRIETKEPKVDAAELERRAESKRIFDEILAEQAEAKRGDALARDAFASTLQLAEARRSDRLRSWKLSKEERQQLEYRDRVEPAQKRLDGAQGLEAKLQAVETLRSAQLANQWRIR
jgi:hypothetical protein